MLRGLGPQGEALWDPPPVVSGCFEKGPEALGAGGGGVGAQNVILAIWRLLGQILLKSAGSGLAAVVWATPARGTAPMEAPVVELRATSCRILLCEGIRGEKITQQGAEGKPNGPGTSGCRQVMEVGARPGALPASALPKPPGLLPPPLLPLELQPSGSSL